MRTRILAFTALLSILAACGDDSTGNNGNDGNNTSSNNITDAGNVGNSDAGPVDMDVPDDTGTGTDAGDPCADVTCSDRGTCAADGQGYTCTCDPGWTGDDCEVCAPDLACGESCCTEAGSVCRAGQCVVPTATVCSRAIPCADGQYCDTELEAADANCTDEAACGLCVDIASTCESGAADCLDTCSFAPQAAGALSAVEKWRWSSSNGPTEFPDKLDVWTTPAVARITPPGPDGRLPAPAIVFVSNDLRSGSCTSGTADGACKKGVLRAVDGATGSTLWTLEKAEPTSDGFAGTSVAIGDLDQDGANEIAALTGEGKLAIVSGEGVVEHLATDILPAAGAVSFGYGGGIALGDMDADGVPDIAYGAAVFTLANGSLALRFEGTQGTGGASSSRRQGTGASYFYDFNGDGFQELIAGNTVYDQTGAIVFVDPALTDGFTGTYDLNGNGSPEVVHVGSGDVNVYGQNTFVAPFQLSSGIGGQPTLADFDGDGEIEIAVAARDRTYLVGIDGANLRQQWSVINHVTSSSINSVTAFDFEGDGYPEVVLTDECFLWVLDGRDGNLKMVRSTQSFGGTETPVVADIDDDGVAELILVHNGADPTQWSCAEHTTGTDTFPVWSQAPEGNYRGITVLEAPDGDWATARPIYNQSSYQVTGVCEPSDDACDSGVHGEIPAVPKTGVSWGQGFKMNASVIALEGFDPQLTATARCSDPARIEVQLRNGSSARRVPIPVGSVVELVDDADPTTAIATWTTREPLFGGDIAVFEHELSGDGSTTSYSARFVASAKTCANAELASESVTCSMPICGNGEIEFGETCEGDCPRACPSSADACQPNVLSGDADTCTSSCDIVPITECVNDDGCCAPGCEFAQDNDCACVPLTCDDVPWKCDTFDDGCGGTISCTCGFGGNCNIVLDECVFGEIGAPCRSDSNCGAGGANAVCGVNSPGGYCTATCSIDANCEGTAYCFDGACNAVCATDADCRDGYQCYDYGGSRTCLTMSPP